MVFLILTFWLATSPSTAQPFPTSWFFPFLSFSDALLLPPLDVQNSFPSIWQSSSALSCFKLQVYAPKPASSPGRRFLLNRISCLQKGGVVIKSSKSFTRLYLWPHLGRIRVTILPPIHHPQGWAQGFLSDRPILWEHSVAFDTVPSSLAVSDLALLVVLLPLWSRPLLILLGWFSGPCVGESEGHESLALSISSVGSPWGGSGWGPLLLKLSHHEPS